MKIYVKIIIPWCLTISSHANAVNSVGQNNIDDANPKIRLRPRKQVLVSSPTSSLSVRYSEQQQEHPEIGVELIDTHERVAISRLSPSDNPSLLPSPLIKHAQSLLPSTVPSTKASRSVQVNPPTRKPSGVVPSVTASAPSLSFPTQVPTSTDSPLSTWLPTTSFSSFASALPTTLDSSLSPTLPPTLLTTFVPTSAESSLHPTLSPSMTASPNHFLTNLPLSTWVPTTSDLTFATPVPTTSDSSIAPTLPPTVLTTPVPTSAESSLHPTLPPSMSESPNVKSSSSPSDSPSTTSVPIGTVNQQPSMIPINQSILPTMITTTTSPPLASAGLLLPSEMPSLAPSSGVLTSTTPSLTSGNSDKPSTAPSTSPSVRTTSAPKSNKPSHSRNSFPSSRPSDIPSVAPSNIPSKLPRSDHPSTAPSTIPTQSSDKPSVAPSHEPSNVPPTSDHPSAVPSILPTAKNSDSPSFSPSYVPTILAVFSDHPSIAPSVIPSSSIMFAQSDSPSTIPSSTPSYQVLAQTPSDVPSSLPSAIPSSATSAPSEIPSQLPSTIPSTKPSTLPSIQPSKAPSTMPSHYPSLAPSPSHKAYTADSIYSFPTLSAEMDNNNKKVFEQVARSFLSTYINTVPEVHITITSFVVSRQSVVNSTRRHLQSAGGLVVDYRVGALVAPPDPANFKFGYAVLNTFATHNTEFLQQLREASTFFPTYQQPTSSNAGTTTITTSRSAISRNTTIYVTVSGVALCMAVFILLGIWLRRQQRGRRTLASQDAARARALGTTGSLISNDSGPDSPFLDSPVSQTMDDSHAVQVAAKSDPAIESLAPI